MTNSRLTTNEFVIIAEMLVKAFLPASPVPAAIEFLVSGAGGASALLLRVYRPAHRGEMQLWTRPVSPEGESAGAWERLGLRRGLRLGLAACLAVHLGVAGEKTMGLVEVAFGELPRRASLGGLWRAAPSLGHHLAALRLARRWITAGHPGGLTLALAVARTILLRPVLAREALETVSIVLTIEPAHRPGTTSRRRIALSTLDGRSLAARLIDKRAGVGLELLEDPESDGLERTIASAITGGPRTSSSVWRLVGARIVTRPDTEAASPTPG